MFGVLACGCPPRQPTQSFRSSTEMNNTFGGESPRAAGETVAALVSATAASAIVLPSHTIRLTQSFTASPLLLSLVRLLLRLFETKVLLHASDVSAVTVLARRDRFGVGVGPFTNPVDDVQNLQ